MLEGKVAVITGGGSGIGAAIARELMDRGCLLWVVDRDEMGLTRLTKRGARSGRSVETIQQDLTKKNSGDNILAQVLGKHRRIHLWINNAGISGKGPFCDQKPADFKRVWDLNFVSVVDHTRAVLAHMEEMGGGTIVNVASIAGHLASPFLASYSASKHAVVGFTRAVREELRLQMSPVQLLLVSPGFVDTKMITEGELQFPSWLRWALSSPEHVARTVVRDLQKNKEEIYPTWNGKLMLQLFRWFPRSTLKGAKVLLARDLKDLFLNRLG